jgi:hypothetical protein
MIENGNFFTPEFKADVLDRIENWQTRQNEKPAWTGFFWPGENPEQPARSMQHHDGRLTVSIDRIPRRRDFEEAINRYPDARTAIQLLQTSMSEGGVTLPEDDLSFFLKYENGQINRYAFHKKMLELVVEPDATFVARIAFVAKRLEQVALTATKGTLLKINDIRYKIFFEVMSTDNGSYTLQRLLEIYELDPVRRASANSQNDYTYWRMRDKIRTPEAPDIFEDQRFSGFITDNILRTDFRTLNPVKTALVLTDMAAQGIKNAQLLDYHGRSYTVVDLDNLSTLKKARAHIHEFFGWNSFAAIRELPEPQIVHRFIVVDEKIIADTPLLSVEKIGEMSEISYAYSNGKTTTSVRSVSEQPISADLRSWVASVIAALHPYQTCVLIDVGLSSKGPNLVAIHDILEEDWFQADHDLIFHELQAKQEKLFDQQGFRRFIDDPESCGDTFFTSADLNNDKNETLMEL